MVDTIEQFKANDGRVFDNYLDAVTHEHRLKHVKFIRDMFPNQSNLGQEEFYRIQPEVVREARDITVAIFKVELEEKLLKAIQAFGNGQRGNIIGRYLDDSGSPTYGLWMLFECIDDHNRMFNQPYFVYNPPKNAVKISY